MFYFHKLLWIGWRLKSDKIVVWLKSVSSIKLMTIILMTITGNKILYANLSVIKYLWAVEEIRRKDKQFVKCGIKKCYLKFFENVLYDYDGNFYDTGLKRYTVYELLSL